MRIWDRADLTCVRYLGIRSIISRRATEHANNRADLAGDETEARWNMRNALIAVAVLMTASTPIAATDLTGARSLCRASGWTGSCAGPHREDRRERLRLRSRNLARCGWDYFFTPAFCFAQRAFWAAEMAARAFADNFRRLRGFSSSGIAGLTAEPYRKWGNTFTNAASSAFSSWYLWVAPLRASSRIVDECFAISQQS